MRGLNDCVDSKMITREGEVHMQFKKKHKTYFLIPSVKVSENVQQTNQKPQAFCCSQDIFFKLLK